MTSGRRVPENEIEASLFRRIVETSVSQWPDLHVMVSPTHDEGIWRLVLMRAGEPAEGHFVEGTAWLDDSLVPIGDIVRFVIGWQVGDQTGEGEGPTIVWPELPREPEPAIVEPAVVAVDAVAAVLAATSDPDRVRTILDELLVQRADAAVAAAQAAGVEVETIAEIRRAVTEQTETTSTAHFA